MLTSPSFDFFFLSYDEPFADEHFSLLTSRFKDAKHLSGVKGVHEVVYVAAKRSAAAKFFVLDADGILDEDFQIQVPPEASQYSTVIWKASNPAIGLQYGVGGLKLYDARDLERAIDSRSQIPENRQTFRKVFDGASGATTCYLDQVANENHFNKAPLTAWRGAFRECFKLSFEQFNYGETAKSTEWLNHWCHPVMDAQNSEWIRLGSHSGIEAARHNPSRWLPIINDFDALREIFANEVSPAFPEHS